MADQPVAPTTPAPAAPAAISSTAPIPSVPGILKQNVPTSPVSTTHAAVTLEPTAPAPVSGVAPTPAAPVAAEKPADKPAEAIAETTLLGSEPKAEDKPAEKPVEQKAPEGEVKAEGVEQKKEEGGQSEQAQPPTYEPFVVPEGMSLDKEKLGNFTKILGDIQVKTKADQKMMQDYGQQLVDMARSEVQESVQRVNDYYKDAVAKQKSDWKSDFEKDPEIGGNRMQTTLNAALNAIKEGASTSKDAKVAEAQLKEVRQLMDGGIGNHKALIRTLANLNGIITAMRTKYESETGVKPLPGTKPDVKKSQVEQRYGKT